jgi:2-dehydro-3-deoxygluconokinase
VVGLAGLDWREIFEREGAGRFHCDGIFLGLSTRSAEVAHEAMQAARDADVPVSYDLNFHPSIWDATGGKERAIQVNRRLARLADVMFGTKRTFALHLVTKPKTSRARRCPPRDTELRWQTSRRANQT